MTPEEKAAAYTEFSELCDQARACLTGRPYAHTEVRFSVEAEPDAAHASLEELRGLVEGCRSCALCGLGRTHVVFGEGIADHPLLMVVGEGPGADEDATGRPFVGRSGQYLDAWLSPIGISRTKNAYIANVVKCRPPQNRTPMPDEVSACLPYLERQIALVHPRLILLSGATAAHALLGRPEGVGRLRGQTFQVQGVPAVVTYHPSGVLRNPNLRMDVWHDIKRVASLLGLPILRGR